MTQQEQPQTSQLIFSHVAVNKIDYDKYKWVRSATGHLLVRGKEPDKSPFFTYDNGSKENKRTILTVLLNGETPTKYPSIDFFIDGQYQLIEQEDLSLRIQKIDEIRWSPHPDVRTEVYNWKEFLENQDEFSPTYFATIANFFTRSLNTFKDVQNAVQTRANSYLTVFPVPIPTRSEVITR